MNTSIFYLFYHLSHKSNTFDRITVFVADKSDKIVLIAAVLYLVYFFLSHPEWKYQKWMAWVWESFIIFVSVIGAYATSYVLKIAFHAPRPFVTHLDVHPLVSETPFSSFPSGHATLFFALATAIYLYDKRVGYVFFIMAALIAISRMVVGVHYPIDIIAGAVIGIGVGYIIHRLLYKILKKAK